MKKLIPILLACSLVFSVAFAAFTGNITTNTTTPVATDLNVGEAYVIATSGAFGGGDLSVQYAVDGTYASYESMDALTDNFSKQFIAVSPELQIVSANGTGMNVDYIIFQSSQ